MSNTHNTQNYTIPISDKQLEFAGELAYACTIPGTIVCGLALVAYAGVAYFPMARKHLDRVSFRLLVQALVFNVLFGIAYTLTPMKDGPGCRFGAFAVNFTLSFATFYTTCIAVNLHLVLVYKVNGKRMEKYYIIVTAALSCALNVPTYALGQFGYNALSDTCWYSNPDDWTRLKWIIGTQSFWISLAAVIETICSCVVLYWLYRYHRTIRLLTQHAVPAAFLGSGPNRDSDTIWCPTSSTSDILSRDPKFRSIILRIALYPIISLLLNFSTVALDLHMSIVGVTSQMDFRLLVLDLFFYGIRTFAYGLLAFIDPSFISALYDIRRSNCTRRALTNINFAAPEITVRSYMTGATDTEGGITPTIKQDNKKDRLSTEMHDITTLDHKGIASSHEDAEVRYIERQL